ncbi:MAG: hypothetical protein J7L55_00730 [Desulfurococcales archaeon]|nr:hypothetical protein [Desulfurococcales archaeon]
MRAFRERLKSIIEAMVGKVVTPGDVVASTGLPRYEVLATFHVLEALGLIELVNEKGNYRVYKVTGLGIKLLKALQSAESLELEVIPKTSQAEAEAEAEA